MCFYTIAIVTIDLVALKYIICYVIPDMLVVSFKIKADLTENIKKVNDKNNSVILCDDLIQAILKYFLKENSHRLFARCLVVGE